MTSRLVKSKRWNSEEPLLGTGLSIEIIEHLNIRVRLGIKIRLRVGLGLPLLLGLWLDRLTVPGKTSLVFSASLFVE